VSKLHFGQQLGIQEMHRVDFGLAGPRATLARPESQNNSRMVGNSEIMSIADRYPMPTSG